MCRDHRCFTACQKQHRQNEPAGQVDVTTRVDGGSRTDVGTTDISGSVKNNTDRMNQLVRGSYQGRSPCDGVSRTDVGTTDISRSVKTTQTE